LWLLKGDVDQAEKHLDQGKAKRVNDFAQRTFDRLPLVEIQVALAKKEFMRALQLADALQAEPMQIYLHVFQSDMMFLRGKALLARGDDQGAREAWRHALTEASQTGSRWMLWQIYAALGERERACAELNFIAQNTPGELRAAFLNMPEVRAILN
jgi:predicted negative regulator of RcsB-dependent stress response